MRCRKCGKKVYESGFCKEHFMEYLEKKVRYTIRKFSLLKKGDKVLVAASGGKDSTVLLYMLHKFGYGVEAVMVEPGIAGYTDKNLSALQSICSKYGIPLKVASFKGEYGYTLKEMLDVLKERHTPMSACAVCGVLRRQLISRAAKGFDAVATGHTMDDEAQAFLMNISRNDSAQALRGGPKSKGSGLATRVKPLYLLKERETTAYSKAMGFPVNYSRCPYSVGAYRKSFRDFLDTLEKKHPNVKDNIIAFYLHEYGGKKPKGTPNRCKICGEPSSGEICKACQILEHLKAY